MKKTLILLIISTMLFAMTGCTDPGDTTPTPSPDNGQSFDGTYSGEGLGHGGKILVDLTIKDSKISEIKVVDHAETQGLANAMNTMADAMIASNSLDVDLVSGATYTSKGFLEAVKNAFSKTGVAESALVKQNNANANAEKRDSAYTADLIIVGAGGAGFISAIEAAQNGASVILLEKLPMVGGNTLLSGGEMAAPSNWLQQKEGIEDSAEQMYNDTLKGGDNENDPKLVRILADNALDAATWLRDEINVTFEDYQLFFGGHSVKRSLVPKDASGVELIEKLKAKADSLNIPVHLNTAANDLIQDASGKVTGVKATWNGQEITYNADKAVILTTGGFGSNIEMRTKYNPMMDEKILSTNSVGSTGDGLVMAEKLGAQLVDMQFIQTYPTCDIETGTLLYVGDVRMEGRAILVNKEGKRFVEELERRDVISKAVTEQTDGVSYLFWDEASMVASGVNVKHLKEYENLIERKMLVKADTIEEAANFFGIDAKELQQTVTNYNQYAKDGKDLEFNKRGELVPFTEGPYYIMVSKPAVHHTMGGLKINTDTQVLTTDGKIIPGLYAAGEVVGDIHGTNRLGSNAIADISVFGRIAGRNAAAEK